MENVNEDFFLPEDIQTEIEKKVKELKDSDPKRTRPVPCENWQKIALSMATKN